MNQILCVIPLAWSRHLTQSPKSETDVSRLVQATVVVEAAEEGESIGTHVRICLPSLKTTHTGTHMATPLRLTGTKNAGASLTAEVSGRRLQGRAGLQRGDRGRDGLRTVCRS